MAKVMKTTCLPFWLILTFCLPLSHAAPNMPLQSADDYFIDGVEAYDDGDYVFAVRSIEKAVALEPDNLEFLYFLGLSYAARKRDQEAIDTFERVVAADPDRYLKAFFQLARLYTRQHNPQKALSTLAAAENVHPDHPQIQLERGYVLQALGETARAIQSFERARALDPTLTQTVTYDIAAAWLQAGELERADEMFARAIEVDPQTPVAEHARRGRANVRVLQRARRPWYLAASIGWGYDDNVPLDPLEEVGPESGPVRDQEDQFQTFLLRGGYKFIQRDSWEAAAGYSMYAVGYRRWVENNLMAHIPHLYVSYRKDPLQLALLYEFSYYYVGGPAGDREKGVYLTFGDSGDDRLRMHSFNPTLTIHEPRGMRTDFAFYYQNKDYLDGVTPDSDFYSGSLVQSVPVRGGPTRVRIGYRFGYEDAAEDDAAYRLHDIHGGISSPLFLNMTADFSVNYIETSYFGSPFGLRRHDATRIVSLSLSRPFSGQLLLQAAYHHTFNDSNIVSQGRDPFRFRKNLILLSLTYIF